MSWLWKSDTTSPAQFEKALARLSTQITAANLSLETTRNRGRRIKALWTLYTVLAYILSVLILVLVIGPQEWSTSHYGGLIGGPVVIFAVRYVVVIAFGWRTGRQQAHLSVLQKQREEKITALKKATKYDSTQELLQKYGGAPPRQEAPKETPQNKKKASTPIQHARTGLPPPPTANIQARPMPGSPISPQRPGSAESMSSRRGTMVGSPVIPEEPGFAPNAFSAQPISYSQSTNGHGGHTGNWYDRILDVLLGDDEASAKNRIVLLCQECRLVNGQAPPGIRTLEELGKWQCASCGAWNGRESEATKMVKEMTEKAKLAKHEDSEKIARGSADFHGDIKTEAIDSEEGSTASELQGDSVSRRVTRSAGLEPVDGL